MLQVKKRTAQSSWNSQLSCNPTSGQNQNSKTRFVVLISRHLTELQNAVENELHFMFVLVRKRGTQPQESEMPQLPGEDYAIARICAGQVELPIQCSIEHVVVINLQETILMAPPSKSFTTFR